MTAWRDLRAMAARVRAEGLRHRVARPRPAHRLDPVLGAVVLGVGLALAGLGWSMAAVERARGFFDPAVVGPVPDPRILSDIRASDAAFADGVMLGDDAFLGRTDGTVLRYDTATEVFAEEALPDDARLTGRLSLLSQGCGDRPGAGLPPCPVEGTLYAVTDRGGLAAREGGRWRVILGDGAWTGPDGTPVEQADVTAWAVSDDGRWMLAAAGDKGLGLFDQQDGAWSVLPPAGGAAPTRIVFAGGTFWLGGPGGLDRVAPRLPLARDPVAGAEGDIYDLDLAPDGGLLALRRGGCTEGCLSILSVSARGTVTVLAGETALSPGLSQARVDHAAMQDGRLVVLGQAGVHVYDPQARNWQALETQAVDAYHAGPDGAVIHFAAAGRFATLRDATLRDRRSLSVPLTQVLPVAGGPVLGLNRDGVVLDLGPDPPVALAFADPGLPQDVRFVAGADVGGTLVLVGPQGVLLHDTVARRYAFQDPGTLPPPLRAARALRLLAAGTQLWAVDMATGQVFLGTPGGDWPARQIAFVAHADLPGPLRSAQADGTALVAVAEDGAPFRVTVAQPGVVEPLTGARLPAALTPDSMAGTAQELLFAEGNDIWSYDLGERAWYGALAGPEDRIADLAIGRRLYALSPSGALYQFEGQAWEPVSGAGPGATVARRNVTDALAAGGRLYLGGDGGVMAYAPDLRRMTGAWSGGAGAVRLVTVQGGVPVWASGGRLWQGDSVVSGDGEVVQGAWPGPQGPVYLAAEDGRLHAVALGPARTCLFRGADAPGGDLVDARSLPDGRLFVLTTGGAAIHDAALHRWTALAEQAGGPDTRLALTADHLLRLDGGRLRAIRLVDLAVQDSCANDVQAVDWQTDETAAALAFDGGTVHLLRADGAVDAWQGGSLRPVLAAPNAAPDPATLRRVYPGTGDLAFAGTDALWRYDLGTRQWTSLPYRGTPPQVAEVDVALGASGLTATVWDGAGLAWGADGGASGLDFAPLVLPPLPAITVPPDTLIDIAAGDGLVAALGTRQLDLFGDRTMTPVARVALPPAQVGWSLQRAEGAAQRVLVDGDPAAPVALHVLDQAQGDVTLDAAAWRYQPGSDLAWALAAPGDLWRIDADLVLWRCAGGPEGCEVAAPAPLAMTAGAIRAVEPDGSGGSYLLTADTLLHLGPDARLLGRVAGPGITPEARLFAAAGQVLLWEGPSRPVWRVAEGRAEPLADRVHTIRRVRGGVALTTDGGLRLYENGAFAAPAVGDAPLTALSLAATDQVYGLDAQGRIRLRDGAAVLDPELTLPAGTLAVHPGQLAVGTEVQRGWYSVTPAGEVRFDWVSACAVPPPPPLPDGIAVGGSGVFPRTEPDPPPPPPVPCPATLASPLRLDPGAHLLQVQGTASAPVLLTTAGEITLDSSLAPVSRAPLRALLADQGAGERGRMQARVAEVAGVSWLAPPMIANSSAGQLVITGPASQVLARGSTTLQPWAAFDLGWLAWDRARGQVRFGAADTGVLLPPAEAIADGRFLPALPGRAAYLGQGRFAWLNARGLWHVQGQRRIDPVALRAFPPVQGLAHGRFLLEGQGVDVATGALTPDNDRFDSVQGALAVAERLRGGGVGSALQVQGQSVRAFGPRGFLFDRRGGIGAISGQTVLLTPLGVVPAAALQGALAVPAGTDRLGQDGAQLFAGQRSGWQALQPDASWQVSTAPGSTQVLAQAGGRRWQRLAGRTEVVPTDPAEGWRVAGRGLDFDADRLVAMAADAQGLVLVTGTGTHVAAGLAAGLAAPVAPDPGARSLDAQTTGTGPAVLWAETGAGRMVWDRGRQQWTQPPADQRPWEARRAAVLGPVTLAFRQGAALATVAVTGLDGSLRDEAFDWGRGDTLPFDRVRALHAEGGRLLLGTDFGLRRLTEGAGLPVQDALFATDVGPPQPVTRLGRPEADPSRLLARSGRGGCLELAGPTAPPQPCADAGLLSTRRVVDTGLWRWTEGDGGVAGTYLLSDGSTVPVPLPLRGGLPHDTLRDRARCAGTEAELWAGLPVSADLQGGVPQRLHPAPGIEALHCQDAAAQLGQGQTLPAGLHGVGAGAALHSAAGWQAQGPAQAQGLADRAAGAVPWEASRLRIGLRDGVATADYRGRDDAWHPLPWDAGRLPVDTPLALSAAGGGVQALTRAGFAGLDRRGATMGIDPATLLLATPDDRAGFAACAPDRIETWDGSVQAAPDRPDGPVVLRCGDGRLYLGQPAGPRDAGAFQPLAEDPLVDRTLVDPPGRWTWARRGAVAGSRGSLEIAFKGEPLALAGGRLSIDDYTAIAAPFADTVELASPMGWWRQPAGDMALPEATRGPGRPAEVTGLAADRDTDGAGLLCLTGATRQVMPAAGPLRRTEACRDWTGRDAVWTWHQTEGAPQATGIALNGVPMTRTLTAGRFADLVVTGAPSAQATGEVVAPTRIGATVLGPRGVAGIHAREGGGAVLRSATGGLHLLGAAGALDLGGAGPVACPAVQDAVLRLPGVPVLRIDLRTPDSASVTLQTAEGRVQLLVPCASVEGALTWAEVLDVSDRPRFLAHRADWPGEGGQLAIAVTDLGFDLGSGAGRGVSVPGLPGGAALALFSGRNGRATFLLAERDLYRVHTDHAIRLVAQQAGPVAALTGPFAPPAPTPDPAPDAAPPASQAPATAPRPPPRPAQPAQPVSPQAAPAAPSNPDARRRLTRQDARAIQARLQALGRYRGAIDGVVGPLTRAAIRQWQRDGGLTPTGYLTDRQFFALLADGGP
ncbi:MAG: peptidoglycan-binding protein [Gemmobacter sp.]